MTHPRGQIPSAHSPNAFPPGSHVAGQTIQRDEARHAFIVDQMLIACTPTEYQVLSLLLAQVNQCVPHAQLIACVQAEPITDPVLLKQARVRMSHLMSDLRAKIWGLSWDIVVMMHTGYMLLISPREENAPVEHNK